MDQAYKSEQEKVKRFRNRRTSSKMDQDFKAEQEKAERIRNMRPPFLPKHLVSEEEYNQYCKDSYTYNYEVHGARLNMRSYADYVKSHRKH